MAEGSDLPDRYRYEWALFADWCAAADLAALPASPLTVAVFLAENPARDAAQRRRVAVVNRVHTAGGHPAPGTVTAIRLRLDRVRTDRAAALRGRAAPIIAALPVAGWPTGMFGRRDAVILALYAAGLRAVDTSRLDRRDITIVGDGVRIGGRHQLQLHPGVDGGGAAVIDYAVVWRRWEQVLRVVQELVDAGARTAPASRRASRPRRRRAGWVGAGGGADRPVGRCPAPAGGGDTGGDHVCDDQPPGGTPARHRPLPTRSGPRRSSAEPSDVPGADDTGLSDTYSVGVAARSAALTALADVGDVLDEVEDRAEELLRRTLALLDDL